MIAYGRAPAGTWSDKISQDMAMTNFRIYGKEKYVCVFSWHSFICYVLSIELNLRRTNVPPG